MLRRRYSEGFALPTIVITSVVMFAILVAAVGTVSSTSDAINTQYYESLAADAAESGVTVANDCLYNNAYKVDSNIWSNSAHLHPGDTCAGSTQCTTSSPASTCFIVNNATYRTTYDVGEVTSGASDSKRFTVTGKVELLRKSTGAVWKTYTSTTAYRSVYATTPHLSGGAGWKDNGHLGYFLSADSQLYGYGANDGGQITDSAAPAYATLPTKIALPSGVTAVKKLISSGQGASYLCIIGNNNSAYCRGKPGALDGVTGIGAQWSLVNLSAFGTNMQVSDLVVNGYGGDNVCVVAAQNGAASSAQVYCFGYNLYGRLGNGDTTEASRLISSPTRFVLPGTLYAKQVFTATVNTCVIASDNNAYCSGRSDWGQIAGTTSLHTVTPVKYQLPSMGSVARYPSDILMAYHGGELTIHVLATDGSLWVSGSPIDGLMGDSAVTSGTGSNPAIWWGQKGGRIASVTNSSVCIDNEMGSAQNYNGSPINLANCSDGLDGTGWALVDGSSHAIYNPTLGRCLDLPYANTANQTKLQLHDCNGSTAQQWLYDSGTKAFRSGVDNSKCIDIPSNNAAVGTLLQIYDCNGSAAQQFEVRTHANPWKAMITGSDYFCGIRDPESTGASGMWCGGANSKGQLLNVGTQINSDTSSYNGGACESTTGTWNVNIKKPASVNYSLLLKSREWQYQYGSLQVIGSDGQVYGAGANDYGKLGNGTASATQCQTVRFQLPDGVTAIDMSTRDEYTTYVLGSDYKVYAAGRNNNGQLGINSTADAYTPQTVLIPHQSTTY